MRTSTEMEMQMSDTPDLAATLARLEARLERLETKLDAVSGAALPARLSDSLSDRVEKIEAMVDAFGNLAQRLPVVADATGTTATWLWNEAQARGIDPIELATRLSQLGLIAAAPEQISRLEKLMAPEQMAMIDTLLSEENMALTKQALGQTATASKALTAAEKIADEDLATVLDNAPALTKSLASLLRNPQFQTLLDQSTSDEAMSTVGYATTALIDTRKSGFSPVGLFGSLSKLGDSDVKRAVGFTLALAKRFGQLLDR